MTQAYILSFLGGILIGLAVTIMLLFNGKITGNSGITAGLLTVRKDKAYWKLFYVVGLIVGALIFRIINAGELFITVTASQPTLMIAGLLVGFGTRLGSGCTSGHGICGCARLSIRSITATTIFVVSGMITVTIVSILEAGP